MLGGLARNDWAGVALTMALDRDLSIHDACIAEANLSLLHQKLKMRRIVRDIIQRYQDRCAPELGEDDELLDNLVTIQMKYRMCNPALAILTLGIKSVSGQKVGGER